MLLVRDNKDIMKVAPLQLYSTALIFSPLDSAIRLCFEDEIQHAMRKPHVAYGPGNIFEIFPGFTFVYAHAAMFVVQLCGGGSRFDSRSAANATCIKTTFHTGEFLHAWTRSNSP